jgi:UPF0271 protein
VAVTPTPTEPLEPFGDAAWRARLPEGLDPAALLAALRGLPGVIDAVVVERHALVTFDPAAPPEGVAEVIARAALAGPSGTATTPLHTIHVRYDGPDLADVRRVTTLTEEEIIEAHTAVTYIVAAVGFLPGFAYLRGLDPRLVLPRRAVPRPRVPAYSVAMAGPYSGVYPFASPGGWHVLGTAVGFTPFDTEQGASLALGDRVKFASVPS